jgi:nucleoside-diphosphate kinase
MERTLVVLKPDAIQRGLAGEIIGRFEKIGLKIIGAKMFQPDKDLGNKHYPKERREWVEGLGNNTLRSYKEQGLDVNKQFGSEDAYKIGLAVHKWLVDFISSGPVLALVLEGPHAIGVTRKIIGATTPESAQPGTIRGDYSFDSPAAANAGQRPIRNLVHASGNKEEADFEIDLWFKSGELFDYEAIHQEHMMP